MLAVGQVAAARTLLDIRIMWHGHKTGGVVASRFPARGI